MKNEIETPQEFAWFCGPKANKTSAIGLYSLFGITAVAQSASVRSFWHPFKQQKFLKFLIEYLYWPLRMLFFSSHVTSILYAESLLLIPCLFPFFKNWIAIIHHVSKNDPSVKQTIQHSSSCFGKIQYFLQPYLYGSLHRARKVIVVSENTRQDVLALGIAPEKIILIPNAIPEKFYQTQLIHDQKMVLREKYGISKHARVLLLFGTDDPRKNFLSFFRALPLFLESDMQVIKFGSGVSQTYRKQCMNIIENLGYAHQVHWISSPQNDAVEEIYSMADVLVFPSIFEGFGRPPVESQALGIPVIASWNSGLKDSLLRESFIMIENPLDEKEIAARIGEFFALPESKKEALILNGRKNAERFREKNIEKMWRGVV